MNVQTEKLLGLLGDEIVTSSKIEDGGKVTISRQDYNGLHIRLAKVCKEAGLKFVEYKESIPAGLREIKEIEVE